MTPRLLRAGVVPVNGVWLSAVLALVGIGCSGEGGDSSSSADAGVTAHEHGNAARGDETADAATVAHHLRDLETETCDVMSWRELGLDLRECELPGASLVGVSLRRANLSDADLSGAQLDQADLFKATLVRAALTEAHLMGANLTSADLRNADLTRVALEGARLTNAKLDGATLQGATTNDMTTCPTGAAGPCW